MDGKMEGHWQQCKDKGWQMCSLCGCQCKKSAVYWVKSSEDKNLNYCPHCGAKMHEATPEEEESDKAVDAWYSRHIVKADKFQLRAVFGVFHKGLPMILFYAESDKRTPWSVQYAGSGKYFESKKEALAYMEDRTGKDLLEEGAGND